MSDRDSADLLGYLLAALDDDQHRKIDEQLKHDPRLRRKLARARAKLIPLQAGEAGVLSPLRFGPTGVRAGSLFRRSNRHGYQQREGCACPETGASHVSGRCASHLRRRLELDRPDGRGCGGRRRNPGGRPRHCSAAAARLDWRSARTIFATWEPRCCRSARLGPISCPAYLPEAK